MAQAREVRPGAANDRMDVPLVANGSGHAVAPRPAERISREAEANCLSTFTFSWFSAIIAEGYRREALRARNAASPNGQSGSQELTALTEEDLFELRPDDLPQRLSETADESWAQESERPVGSRSLRRTLVKAFGGPFFVAAIFKFFYDTLQMAGPYILKELLGYLKECEVGGCELGEGLKWVGVMLLSNFAQTMLLHQYFHRCFRTGMRLNAASINLIYKKSLRIAGPGKTVNEAAASGPSPSKRGGSSPAGAGGAAASAGASAAAAPAATASTAQQSQWSTGKIVNLMSTDSQRLQDLCTYLATLWSGPYQIIITLIFLYAVVSWATFAGLGVLILQIPLVGMISRRVKKAQNAVMAIKDERLKVTNEIFASVKLLKMYGWEEAFERRLTEVRNRELKQLRRYQTLNIVSGAMWMVSPILTSVATFGVYVSMGYTLEAKTAFAAMALFNVLRFPLTMFPNTISSTIEANVALKRIEDFLACPEIEGRRTPPQQETQKKAGVAIALEDAAFEWPGGTPLMSGLTFSVPAPKAGQERAHLTVVLGSVGVGKSGLLQALIGDLSPKSSPDSVFVSGRIAYSSQVAWIRNATVKENILFNAPFDQDWYDQVVRACQLEPDLEQLPSGDATEIGEKGVNLSGGQRQRVSLARAVYARADILLLDDPLSAVDSEVAKKLLRMLRGDLVKSSSIVLCTHNLGAISQADQVILLEREGSSSASLPVVSSAQQPGGSSSSPSTTNARAAFVGPVKDFSAKYPEMSSHGGAGREFTRQASDDSQGAADGADQKKKDKKGDGRLTQGEVEQQGSVQWKVYKTYIDAAGGNFYAGLVIAGLVFGQAFQTATDTWVSFWSDHSKDEGGDSIYISSLVGILGYAGTSMLAFFGVIATNTLFRTTALKAARSFHEQLLETMLKLPMSFYDKTPMGRVINRFSKDVYVIDEVLVSILVMYFNTVCRVFATIVVITAATPWFLVIIIPLLALYRHTQNYYVPTSRQLKRIESNLRAPIFSHFDETLVGVSCIRAFGQQSEFIRETLQKVQRNMRGYYMSVASNRWLAVRLETLGTVIVASSGLLAVLARDKISAGIAGLSISYALSVTQTLNWVVRMTSDRETNIVSVERLEEYIKQDKEPAWRAPSDPPESQWPNRGGIEFQAVQLRYRENLPLVLDGLNLSVAPGEKIGICGRTGAGKSSMLNVLLRIVELSGGKISIDGIDIGGLGLHRLRRSITVLPQDPVLFSGTLRFNLDPLEETGNGAMWQALDRAHLNSHIKALWAQQQQQSRGAGNGAEGSSAPGSPNIDMPDEALDKVQVSENGENFSVGQRQQMCLARALLRSNKILLLDEATSAVDMETDAKIQQTLKEEFAQQTVLCIAHRISTILHYDRACVVDAGQVAELGPPKELMNKAGSRFKRLADHDRSR